MMPGMDGFLLAEQIKNDPDLAGSIIMMLSSADQPSDAARCRTLGVANYLTKPITQSDLLKALTKVLQSTPIAASPSTPRRGRRLARATAGNGNGNGNGHGHGRVGAAAAAPHPAGRGQRRQPDAGGPPAQASRARGDRGRGRVAGAGRVRRRAVRPGADGRADAQPRRLRGDRADPPARAGDGPAHADHRHDGPRHEGQPRGMPRRGLRRVPGEAACAPRSSTT